MNRFVYLDNNATTKVDGEVLTAMLPFLEQNYGNASSLYAFGKDVKKEIEKARKNVAKLLGANSKEIIFTSGASESNVTAIMSAVKTNPNKRHIITTSVEHASIMETMRHLESCGYNITYLPVDASGKISLQQLESEITGQTLLICVMAANNEIGNIYPIKEIGEIARKHNCLFHCDAVQAVGKIPINVELMNIDTLSLSGHKIHAPKGIGVLYKKDSINFEPLIYGHQERERRGGTENVAGIVALGKAAELILEDDFKSVNQIESLRNLLEKNISSKINGFTVYGDTQNRLANTSSIGFEGVNAQELMFLLERDGFLVSTGSACNSSSPEPSHVLVACGADITNYSPIRVSLSKYTTRQEIEDFTESLAKNINKLRKN